MPQEFQILRCCECEKFQVHHVKKAKKWQCKVCGLKQSLKKAFFIGSSRDCRVNVQKLNFQAGEKEMKRQLGESYYPTDEFVNEDLDFSSENDRVNNYDDETDWVDENGENDWFDETAENSWVDEIDRIEETSYEILDNLHYGNLQNDFEYELPRKKKRCESYSKSGIVKEDILNEYKEDQRDFQFPFTFKSKQGGNSNKPIESANHNHVPKMENKQESGLFKNIGKRSLIEDSRSRLNSSLKPTKGFQLILNEAEKQRSHVNYNLD